MTGPGLLALAGLAVLVVIFAIRWALGHRASDSHGRVKPPSRTRLEAEEERDLLKTGSLWGDVPHPLFAPRSRSHR